MPYGDLAIHVSAQAVLIDYEWDNTLGGELYLYDWSGAELRSEMVVYRDQFCRRPALFRDRVLASAIGPSGDCFDNPSRVDLAVYGAHLMSVSKARDFEYNSALDDFEFYHTLTSRYYGYNDVEPLISSVRYADDIIVEAVSDVGLIYRDTSTRVTTPPVTGERAWSTRSLVELLPSGVTDLEIKSGAYEALYGVLSAEGAHTLYQLSFEGVDPQEFKLVRHFSDPVLTLTDHHLVVSEEPQGIWVRHKSPACTVSGACAR